MSPKNTLDIASRSSDGQRLRRCRKPPRKAKKKKSSKKLKLKKSEANKSLYICHIEYHPGRRVSYVVRSIKLSDLLLSDPVDGLQLQQVAYKPPGDDEEELPSLVGCGVLGSQIVFAAGVTPAVRLFAVRLPNPVWHRDVFFYETDPDKQPSDSSVIQKMDAKLVQGKHIPVMEELGGKLYALSYDAVSDPPSFEVFDPTTGAWSVLPEPPFFRPGQYQRGGSLSYAITTTKMFVSHSTGPVFCFDVVHPRREWRLVHSMCQGGPFPFNGRALVLDLPGDNNSNKKLMFAYVGRWNLGVYIMFLDKNRESLTQIAGLKLPMFPEEFAFARRCFLLHIGGCRACLVAPSMCPPEEELPNFNEAGCHKTRGVAIPFRFEVDITKIDKDAKNCLTLQFMPTRIFEFDTNPSSFPSPRADGCFVL